MPTMTIETGTISSTVLSYAQNMVNEWQYYVLFDSDDTGNDEEYTMICADDFQNDSFVSPVVYVFRQIQVTDSHNHLTSTYQIQRYEWAADLAFPSNNNNLVVYTNIPDSYYPNFEKRVDNAQTQNLLLFTWLVPVVVFFVAMQFIMRKHSG